MKAGGKPRQALSLKADAPCVRTTCGGGWSGSFSQKPWVATMLWRVRQPDLEARLQEAAISMSDDAQPISEYLDDLRARIQVKLARGGAPADFDTLRLVCLAMALRVTDPAGIRLFTMPLSPQLYPALETMLAQVDRDFIREIDELQDLIADAQEDPEWQMQMHEAVQAGSLPAELSVQDHIARLVLSLFVELDEEA
jgi:hypothetical protein